MLEIQVPARPRPHPDPAPWKGPRRVGRWAPGREGLASRAAWVPQKCGDQCAAWAVASQCVRPQEFLGRWEHGGCGQDCQALISLCLIRLAQISGPKSLGCNMCTHTRMHGKMAIAPSPRQEPLSSKPCCMPAALNGPRALTHPFSGTGEQVPSPATSPCHPVYPGAGRGRGGNQLPRADCWQQHLIHRTHSACVIFVVTHCISPVGDSG